MWWDWSLICTGGFDPPPQTSTCPVCYCTKFRCSILQPYPVSSLWWKFHGPANIYKGTAYRRSHAAAHICRVLTYSKAIVQLMRHWLHSNANGLFTSQTADLSDVSYTVLTSLADVVVLSLMSGVCRGSACTRLWFTASRKWTMLYSLLKHE